MKFTGEASDAEIRAEMTRAADAMKQARRNAEAKVLREAADMVRARFSIKQPHPKLWMEIEHAVRAMANVKERGR